MKTLPRIKRFAILLAIVGASAPIVVSGCGGTLSTPPLPANYRPNADLTYSAVSTVNNAFTDRVLTLSTGGTNNLNGVLVTSGNGTQNLELSGINRIAGVSTERRFDLFLEAPAGRPFEINQKFPLAFGTRNNILIRQSNPNGDRLWQSDGGLATITAVGPNSIQVSLTDARFVPSPTFFAVGEFLLTGSIGATGLRAATS